MFTLNKLMLLAHTQIAKQYNYAIHKKIIGLIKIINCWYTAGSGRGPAMGAGGNFPGSVKPALCHWTDDFLGRQCRKPDPEALTVH